MTLKLTNNLEDNEIFIWLSIIKKMNYCKMLNLLRAFGSVKKLYLYSKNKTVFEKILFSSNITINKEIFSSIINESLKNKAHEIYLNLKSQNLKFLNIFSNLYPQELKQSINAPLIIVYYGNIDLLNSRLKKVYIYNEEENYKMQLIKKEVIYTDDLVLVQDEKSSVINYQIQPRRIYTICREDIFKSDFKNYNNITMKNSLIFYVENEIIKNEVITSIVNFLFVLRASFNKKIFIISSLMLEKGKDILVIPGDIYYEKTYFSNYLLREGAQVILNREDIKYYLSK